MKKLILTIIIVGVLLIIGLPLFSTFKSQKLGNSKNPVNKIVSALDRQTQQLKKINYNLERIAVKRR